MSVIACPYCAAPMTITPEQAAAGAVRCPRCRNPLSLAPPALPASEPSDAEPDPTPRPSRRRAKRAEPEEPAEADDRGNTPVRASGCATFGGCLLIVLACGGAFSCWSVYKQRALDDLAAADRLYAEGKKAEAVAKYKDRFSHVPDDRRAEVIKRVADHEATAGDKAEARRWVEKGLDGKMTVAYESPAARDLLAQVQRERAEAEARRVAEREAHDKARQEADAKRKADRETREKAEREAEEKRQRYGSSTDAHRMAETFVKRQLTFPSEAKFGLLSFLTSQNPDKSWKVSGDVTAKNAFGVKEKYRFQVVILRGEDGVWQEVEPVILVELTN